MGQVSPLGGLLQRLDARLLRLLSLVFLPVLLARAVREDPCAAHDHSDRHDRCIPVAPSVAEKSVSDNGAEILKYGKVLLPATPIFPTWRWSSNFDMSVPVEALAGIKAFDSRADVKAAFQELRKLGDSLPRVVLQQSAVSLPSAA